MGVDESANGAGDAALTVGRTSQGMMRIPVQDGGKEPHEAGEIADELRAAGGRARAWADGRAGAQPMTARSARSGGGGWPQ
jgi:hypothetical protein